MEIRNYQEGDEKKIVELFELVFKKKLPLDIWKWRFDANPAKYKMIKLMWDGDILAGHYALSPTYLKVDNARLLTALSMTTMTHPEYGGRGIFSDLADSLYNEEYEQRGLLAIWGFPNNNSHYGFIKNLKWKDVVEIPFLSMPANALKPSSDPIELKEIFTFTDQHSLLADQNTKSFRIKTDRYPEMLNWRYFDNPEFNYRVFEFEHKNQPGYVVTKCIPGFTEKDKFELDLVEIMCPADFGTLHSLLNAILKAQNSGEIYKLNTWLPLFDPKHILLEKAGFTHCAPSTYHGVRVMGEDNILYDPREWFICMGDSDVF
jgi:hypothetical protein